MPTPAVISFQIVFPNAMESTSFSSTGTTTSIAISSSCIRWTKVVLLVNVATQMLMEVMFLKHNMAKPVLVTGFEPFGNHSVNISGEIAKELDGHEIRGHKVQSHVLSVDYEGSMLTSQLLDESSFAAIIHLGLAENAPFPRIEIRAKDILDFRIPDNSGRQVRGTHISGEGDLFSTVKPEDWDIDTMIDSPVISDDAGEYICNETLYRTLMKIDNTEWS